jgi:predicted HicB family RNase H-like nuclease
LPTVPRQARSKGLFISRLSPEVSANDIEKSLKEQLSLKKLVCTTLKAKFNTYASFHVSVFEDEFPLINNTGI